MTLKEVLAHVIDWLQQDKRITYRALKRQLDLDGAYLEDLKAELIQAAQRGRQRGHVDGANHAGTARAVPPVAAQRAARHIEPSGASVLGARPDILPATHR